MLLSVDFFHVHVGLPKIPFYAFLPEWLSEIRIDHLVLRGKIPLKERRKAKKWFPNVEFKEIEVL